MEWRTDIEDAPRDRTILAWGIPETHPHIEVSFHGPAIFAVHWEPLDESFCLNGGDWMGPFITPDMWAEVEPPK